MTFSFLTGKTVEMCLLGCDHSQSNPGLLCVSDGLRRFHAITMFPPDQNKEAGSGLFAYGSSKALFFPAEDQQSVGGSARTSLLMLVSIFTCAASVMYLVYRNFPELSKCVLFSPFLLGNLSQPTEMFHLRQQ